MPGVLLAAKLSLVVLRSVGNLFRVAKSVYDEVIQPLGSLGFALLIVSLVCGGNPS